MGNSSSKSTNSSSSKQQQQQQQKPHDSQNNPQTDPSQQTQQQEALNKKKELTVEALSKSQRRKLQKYCYNDEINYTVGVLNMLATVVVAIRFSAHYWIWHLIRTSFYFPTRYFSFKQKNYELYMLDWCYVVTYLSTGCTVLAFLRLSLGLHTILEQYNQDLIHAGFAMACGPLAWSVFVFRNSLVFYDIEHSTSVFIHLSPFALFWCLRWGSGTPSVIETTWPTMFHVCKNTTEFQEADACLDTWKGMLWCNACYASPWAFVLPPAILYVFVWAVPYYVVVLIWWRVWCEETGHETLFSYFAETYPSLKKWCDKYLGPVVGLKHAGSVGYMIGHFLSMMLFCSTSYLVWHSFLLHTLLIAFVLAKAVQNGSTYMFRVFAYRYVAQKLKQHREEIEKVD